MVEEVSKYWQKENDCLCFAGARDCSHNDFIDWSIAGIGEGVTYKCSLSGYCLMFTWL
jgi:hypothetical protein